MKSIFTDHPASIGESYGEHLRSAAWFGLAMIGAGLACIVHGIIPALFVRTASSTVNTLHERMLARRRP